VKRFAHVLVVCVDDDDATAQIYGENNEFLSINSQSNLISCGIVDLKSSTKHEPTSGVLLFLYALHSPKYCIFLYQDCVKENDIQRYFFNIIPNFS